MRHSCVWKLVVLSASVPSTSNVTVVEEEMGFCRSTHHTRLRALVNGGVLGKPVEVVPVSPLWAMMRSLLSRGPDNGGVTFVPALSGLGAPYWDPEATGAIMGITRGTEKGHIARAALEAIALRSRDIIIEMQKDAGVEFSSLKVDGGATGNDLLMQIQADLLQKQVVRPNTTETTALGAAFFAGLAVGFWKDEDELQAIWKEDRVFSPLENSNNKRCLTLWEQRVPKQ